MPKGSLKNRFIVAGERSKLKDDAAAEATRDLREMISSGRLATAIAVQSPKGGWQTQSVELDGPIAYVESTTDPDDGIFPEDLNRYTRLSTDQSDEQTEAIINQMALAATLPSVSGRETGIQQLHHTAQRLLQSLEVVIPYAPELPGGLPVTVLQARRGFGHLLSLIQAVALLYQYQRDRNEHGQMIATIEDYDIVRHHLVGPLSRSLKSKISPGAAELLGVVEGFDGEFTVKDLVIQTGLSGNTVQHRLYELGGAGQIIRSESAKGSQPAKYLLATCRPNVIENLKRMHGLPCVHICNKCLYPKEAVKRWIESKVDNH